jgi:hypothetical protein
MQEHIAYAIDLARRHLFVMCVCMHICMKHDVRVFRSVLDEFIHYVLSNMIK